MVELSIEAFTSATVIGGLIGLVLLGIAFNMLCETQDSHHWDVAKWVASGMALVGLTLWFVLPWVCWVVLNLPWHWVPLAPHAGVEVVQLNPDFVAPKAGVE